MNNILVRRYHHDNAQFDYWKGERILQVFCPVVIMLSDTKNNIESIASVISNA